MSRNRLAAAIVILAAVSIFLVYKFNRPAGTSAPTAVEAPAARTSGSPGAVSSDASHPSSGSAGERATTPGNATANGVAPAANDLSARAGQYIPDTNAPTNLPPETVLQNVHHAIHQFGDMFGGNPVGTNPEITAALTGKNPKQINFLSTEPGIRINAQGEMIDPWGTPYFFHQLSGTVMEIHSAGPDRILWTSDDLVTQ
jgi:hypothetical protein